MRIDCSIIEMKLEATYYTCYSKCEYLNIFSYKTRWNPRLVQYMTARCNKDNFAHHEDIKFHFSSFDTAFNYAMENFGVNMWITIYLSPERRLY